jgi:GNAT superfamily N-acetyltransferase
MIHYFPTGLEHLEAMVNARIAFQQWFLGQQSPEAIALLSHHLRQYFLRAIANGSCICWMAAVDEEIVGNGMMAFREYPGNFLNPSGKTGYIMNMHTLEQHRGKGIASTILKRLIATAKEMGTHAFELHATPLGAPVYERNGFLKHHEPTYRIYTEQASAVSL